ncbi:TniQ family protein [Sphingomonas abietis]|uniref:TniQ family protein n=1 Tax=Sphingomonas abietis TaxID=3012344 RepID=A0ABY7NMM0_9SPHN|nr:TniQ family protein [Sphingomonas abietis]WBO22744.1 TniQ family protein [Sphingomonas abietis]
MHQFNLIPSSLRVRWAEGEPAWGLLNRLALRSDSASARDLLATSAVGSIAALHEAIVSDKLPDALSRISGFSIDQINSGVISAKEIQRNLGRMNWISKSSRLNQDLRRSGRVCPQCLDEDMQTRSGLFSLRPFRRAEWDLRFLAGCDRHDTQFLDVCPECHVRFSESTMNPVICNCGNDNRRLIGTPLQRKLTGFDRYIYSRLLLKPCGDNILDDYSIAHARLLVLSLGRALSNVPLAQGGLLKQSETELLVDVGWSALSEGLSGLQNALDHALPELREMSPGFRQFQNLLIRRGVPRGTRIDRVFNEYLSSRFVSSHAGELTFARSAGSTVEIEKRGGLINLKDAVKKYEIDYVILRKIVESGYLLILIWLLVLKRGIFIDENSIEELIEKLSNGAESVDAIAGGHCALFDFRAGGPTFGNYYLDLLLSGRVKCRGMLNGAGGFKRSIINVR